MAFEALMAEYEARRAKALGMRRRRQVSRGASEAGQLNARERIAPSSITDSFIESGLFGTSGVYPNDADETQTDGKLAGFASINGRDVAVVVNDFTVKGASTSATNGKKIGHMKRTATERGMPLRAHRRIHRRAAARRDGLARHGPAARQRQHAVPPHARDADGGRRVRPVVRLVGLARLPVRLRGDAEGRDHGGVEPAPGRNGAQRKGRSRGTRRLAACTPKPPG